MRPEKKRMSLQALFLAGIILYGLWWFLGLVSSLSPITLIFRGAMSEGVGYLYTAVLGLLVPVFFLLCGIRLSRPALVRTGALIAAIGGILYAIVSTMWLNAMLHGGSRGIYVTGQVLYLLMQVGVILFLVPFLRHPSSALKGTALAGIIAAALCALLQFVRVTSSGMAQMLQILQDGLLPIPFLLFLIFMLIQQNQLCSRGPGAGPAYRQ